MSKRGAVIDDLKRPWNESKSKREFGKILAPNARNCRRLLKKLAEKEGRRYGR